MKKLLIVIGAFAVMYWAYKAGERTAIRACEAEIGSKRGDGSDPDTPEPGADAETPEPEEGAGMDDETANFIGMTTEF